MWVCLSGCVVLSVWLSLSFGTGILSVCGSDLVSVGVSMCGSAFVSLVGCFVFSVGLFGYLSVCVGLSLRV